MLDLLVIGAGLAGLSAAVAAAKAGLNVRVIAKGQGVTHWHAGTLDVLGYLPLTDAPIQAPLAASQTLPPEHPYRLLGETRLRDALAMFSDWLAASKLAYPSSATPDQNLWLPSAVGAVRPTFLAPQAQLAGDVSRPEPMLIVGFHGLRDFYPQWIVENLTKQGYLARAAFLPLNMINELLERNNVQLAEQLEPPSARGRLAAALKKLCQPGERIGLPAILGVNEHLAVWQDLQTEVDAPIFEIPTLPPSVPGIRLYRALQQQLMAAGGRIEMNMEALAFKAEGQQIQWVETATSARPLKHYAKNFLLATGGVLGGGFNSDHTGRFWETIFDLPLTVPQDRNAWFRHQFLHPQGQPVFSGGVLVNDHFQPVEQNGTPVYNNLWAVGGVLAHADPIRERSLEGIAIATGISATQGMIAQTHAGV
ncbi:MAG: glycerol-3-phosphate dehydrogenase subunit GlpB [Chloroflexi bacterium]|nr:glycerol-3-phosphate dehydrogenase subunit GlpB [Chloroflexota bacterium]